MIEESQHQRTELLLGEKALNTLRTKRVAVFGLGGVGGSCVEALARAGVGHLDLIDNDTVALSNLNRQLFATRETIGMKKTEAAAMRIRSIDPDIELRLFPLFYLPETKDQFPFEEWDFIIDAIDTVSAKLSIIEEADRRSIPILSAMGCGNRLDPSRLSVMDLYDTRNDPLARIMRSECRKRRIRHLTVVTSTETPLKPLIDLEKENGTRRRAVPGSSPFVPCAAGLLLAYEAVRQMLSLPSSR